ncbi:unnamed protein product [Rhizopus stolonifer]
MEKIISDTQSEISYGIQLPKREQENRFEYKISSHVDQAATYEEVYHYLNQGECVAIFLEDEIHDGSELLPLKDKYNGFIRLLVPFLDGFIVMTLGAATAKKKN